MPGTYAAGDPPRFRFAFDRFAPARFAAARFVSAAFWPGRLPFKIAVSSEA